MNFPGNKRPTRHKGGRLSVPAISINIGGVPDTSGFLQHRDSFKLSNSCQFLNQYGEEARSSFARRPSNCLSIGSDHFDLKLYQNCSVRKSFKSYKIAKLLIVFRTQICLIQD